VNGILAARLIASNFKQMPNDLSAAVARKKRWGHEAFPSRSSVISLPVCSVPSMRGSFFSKKQEPATASIQIVAGFAEVIEGKKFSGCGGPIRTE